MIEAGAGSSMTRPTASPSFRIELRIPGETPHLRASRLVAASTATMLGYDVDALWEVRCGVDELCGILLRRGCPQLDLVFEDDPSNGCLLVEGAGSTVGAEARPSSDGVGVEFIDLDDIVVALIGAVTEAWQLDEEGTSLRFVARFRPPSGSAPHLLLD